MSILGDNFVGAYLQGSFAIGDHSPYSDCDFLIVTREDLNARELTELRRLHKEIPTLPYPYWRTGWRALMRPRLFLNAGRSCRAIRLANRVAQIGEIPAALARPPPLTPFGMSTTDQTRWSGPNTTTPRWYVGH